MDTANELVAPVGKELMCKNCGARTIVSKQATRCPFCDDAMVVEVDVVDVTIVPEAVLPFGLDKTKADTEFRAWLARVPARKVVGVGSVGTRAWIVLLVGRDEHDVHLVGRDPPRGRGIGQHLVREVVQSR